MPAELEVSAEWRGALSAAGLDTFEAMMQSSRGECVSWHTRGQVHRIGLAGGEVIFLKRDAYTMWKDVAADLWRLGRPQPPCVHESQAIGRAAALGILVPEVIARGQRRRAGLPWQAVLVTRRLPGEPMDALLGAAAPRAPRRDAIRSAGNVAARLYEHGLSWPDLLPKHFTVHEDTVGVLDLARMRPARRPWKTCMPRQVRRFCRQLRACGGDDDDVAAFLDGVGHAGALAAVAN